MLRKVRECQRQTGDSWLVSFDESTDSLKSEELIIQTNELEIGKSVHLDPENLQIGFPGSPMDKVILGNGTRLFGGKISCKSTA